MTRGCFLIFVLLSGFDAFARDDDFGFWRIGANVNIVGSEEINQTAMQWDPAVGVEIGYEFEPWSLGVGWRRLSLDSDSGGLEVASKQERIMVIGRRYWHGDTDWLAWAQADAGMQWYDLDLGIGAEKDSMQSDRELVTGLGVGFAWPLSPNWRSELSGLIHKTQTRSSLETSASVSLVFLL